MKIFNMKNILISHTQYFNDVGWLAGQDENNVIVTQLAKYRMQMGIKIVRKSEKTKKKKEFHEIYSKGMKKIYNLRENYFIWPRSFTHNSLIFNKIKIRLLSLKPFFATDAINPTLRLKKKNKKTTSIKRLINQYYIMLWSIMYLLWIFTIMCSWKESNILKIIHTSW